MGGPLLIRRAVVEDALGIAQVRVRTWQAGYRGIIPQSYLDGMDEEDNAKRAATWFSPGAPSQNWVGVLGDQVVGWTSVFPRARDQDTGETVGEIAACYALPRVWGAGVGYKMMEVVTASLRDQGVDTLVLWVLQDNARATRFYVRQGFQPDGTTREESMIPGSALTSIRLRRLI